MATLPNFSQRIKECPKPSAQQFLTLCAGTYFDQVVYYWGLEPETIDRLKAADVLIIGNSHVLNVFSGEALSSFFARHGLTYYVMGLPAELAPFYRRLIDRYDLQPTLMVINNDLFFARRAGIFGTIVLEGGILTNLRHVLDYVASRAVLSVWGSQAPERNLIHIMRSKIDGTWANDFRPDRHDPLPFGFTVWTDKRHWHRRRVMAEQREEARAFLAELGQRGIHVVSMAIPHPSYLPDAALQIATDNAISFLHPTTIEEFFLYDGTHMDVASGRSWLDAFLTLLESDPTFVATRRAR